MFVRLFDAIARLVVTLFVTLLVFFAIYVSLGRYYVPLLNQYKDIIVTDLKQRSGLNFSIDRLEGEWRKFSPVINLSNFQLLDEQGNEAAFSVDEFRVAFDFIDSIKTLSVKFDRAEMRGVEFNLVESADHSWSIKTVQLGNGDKPMNIEPLINVIMGINVLEFVDVVANLSFLDGRQLSLDDMNLKLQRSGNFRRLSVSLSDGVRDDDGAQERKLLMIVESRGDPRKDSNFSADIYAKFNQLDLKNYLSLLAPGRISISALTLDGEAWLEWKKNGEIKLQTKLGAPVLEFRTPADDLLSYRQLQSHVYAERDRHSNWKLWAPTLSVGEGGKSKSPIKNMFLTLSKSESDVDKKAGEVLGVAAESIELEVVNDLLLGSEVLPEKLVSVLSDLDPRGTLDNFSMHIPLDAESWKEHFSFRSRLHNVWLDSWHASPSVRALSGSVTATGRSGTLSINAEDFAIGFPKVYEDPLQYQHLSGDVSWYVGDEFVQVNSDLLTLQDPSGNARAQLRLRLPIRKEYGDPWMTLLVGTRSVSLKEQQKYIPLAVSDKLRNWLDNSLHLGSLIEGGFIYHGRIGKPHHDPRKPDIQLFLDARDVELAYHDDWPPVYGVRTMVVIDNGALDARVHKAHVYESDLTDTSVLMAAVEEGETPVIHIDGQLSGDLSDAFEFVNHSPLKARVGDVVANWLGRGNMNVALQLAVPIDSEEENTLRTEVSLDMDLSRISLTMPGLGLNFRDVEGQLHFDDKDGLGSKGLKGILWDDEISTTISSRPRDGAMLSTLRLQGAVDAQDLREWSGLKVLAFAEGKFDFSGDLVLGAEGGDYIELHSGLEQLAVALPQPFNKSIGTSRKTVFRSDLDSKRRDIFLQSGDDLKMHLTTQGKQLLFGDIVVGNEELPRGNTSKLRISGTIDEFSLHEWQPVFDRYAALVQEAGDDDGGEDSKDAAIFVDEMTIGRLIAFDRLLGEATVSVRDNEGWDIDLETQYLRGRVTVYPGQKPHDVQLEYLNLSALLASRPDNATSDTADEDADYIDPGSFPPMSFSVDELQVDDEDWGSWSFDLRVDSHMAVVNNLSASFKGLRLLTGEDGEVRWFNDGQTEYSSYRGKMFIDKLGETLQIWGYAPILESKASEFTIDVRWPGAPQDIAVEYLDGSVAYQLAKGNFIEAPNTASNALKVISIFNLAKLLNRLQLDFSDLSKKGLTFDALNGSLRIEKGMVYLDTPTVVQGSSSEIAISGKLDLFEEEVDGRIVVTLPLGSNLPWMAAVAVGLPAAAGVYVVSKVLKKQVDQLSSASYSVTGDWNQPDIKFDSLFSNNPKAAGRDSPDGSAAETAPTGAAAETANAASSGKVTAEEAEAAVDEGADEGAGTADKGGGTDAGSP